MEEILDKFLGLVPKEDLEKLKKLIEEKDKKIEELQQAKEERLYDLYALDEDIQYLEDLISFARALLITPQKATIQEKEIETIEHLIERYKELEEQNKSQQTLIDVLNEKVETFRKENVERIIQNREYELHYIPKSKIKEKIEELRNENYEDITFKYNKIEVNGIIEVILQELLEEK